MKPNLRRFLDEMTSVRRTLLCIGPMSKNCVDAAIEIGAQMSAPMVLIASRRQVECAHNGGGYVNNWSTEDYSRYVFDNDFAGSVVLARDHGGPWQGAGELESQISYSQAMASAKESFAVDIESGFVKIHIDTCLNLGGPNPAEQALDRFFELLEFCHQKSSSLGRELVYEMGTEEQSGITDSPEEFESLLATTLDYCSRQRLPKPKFIVVQTGTRVMDVRNVGVLGRVERFPKVIPSEVQIPKMLAICKKYDIFLKQHNTDYLSTEVLTWHPWLGIHAANIAPEFGVAETRALLKLCVEANRYDLHERFVELAVDSGKWRKWVHEPAAFSDCEKAEISGHYVFSTDECVEIKRELSGVVKIDIDEILKKNVKAEILRYVGAFNVGR